jgi:hypothetical protein
MIGRARDVAYESMRAASTGVEIRVHPRPTFFPLGAHCRIFLLETVHATNPMALVLFVTLPISKGDSSRGERGILSCGVRKVRWDVRLMAPLNRNASRAALKRN